MNVQFGQCTLDDLPVLKAFSESMYYETFRGMCSREDMEAYLKDAFSLARLREELLNPCSRFYFLVDDTGLSGYMKLNEAGAQSNLQDTESIELERIYIKKESQERGYGAFLLRQAFCIAKKNSKRYIWLGVWEKNTKAIAFYREHGFSEIGTYAFVMGEDVQTDYLMRKDV